MKENEDIGPSSSIDIDMQETEDIGLSPNVTSASSPSTRNIVDLNDILWIPPIDHLLLVYWWKPEKMKLFIWYIEH
ncbi:hypothetical protein HanRHA438_Chr06g0285901 [Helianthus annuus]|nr:hypothetical protein HanRHA438_Chr06g0285901 [Helianthus annuus]